MKKHLLLDISGVLILQDRWGNTKTNKELIDYLIAQKERFSYALITNADPQISGHIESVYAIPKFYSHFISSQTYGLSKSDPKLYEEAMAVLLANPEECIFVDDTEKNVAAAVTLGITGLLYRGFEEFKKDLQKIQP